MPPVKSLFITYNLQLFAQDGPGGEKTEKATPKRKEKAREEGQVAKSTEIGTAFFFIIMFSILKSYGGSLLSKLTQLFKTYYTLFSIKELDTQIASQLIGYALKQILTLAAPVFLTAFLLGFITSFMQVGWHPTLKPLMPKFSRMSPISGFKRLFSLKAIVELIKSIAKLSIILAIIYNAVKDYEALILTIFDIPVLQAYGMIATLSLDIGIRVGGFFLIIALLDYLYQRYDLNKNLKMTKQEIKDEYKQSEGNPEIKSKIRQKMREAAMRRMMQDLPKADVIITNPTHFAVAISYDTVAGAAPKVIAKGTDLVAARIKEKAKEYHVEIVENKPLARTLYYTVEIGEEIPPELYQAVAEILAFVYNLNKEKAMASR